MTKLAQQRNPDDSEVIICQGSQGQRFDGTNRVFSACSVREHTREFWDFGDPAAVVFAISFDLEGVSHYNNYISIVEESGEHLLKGLFARIASDSFSRGKGKISGVWPDGDVHGAGAECAD